MSVNILQAVSDAEYDSHDEHCNHVIRPVDVISNISKETANLFQETVVPETINFSPLDTVFTETLTSVTSIPNSSPKNKTTFCSPRSVTSTSEYFKESLVSETTYSPQPIQDDPIIPINYSPSAVPAKYVPENFSCATTSIFYSPFTGNDMRSNTFSFTAVSSAADIDPKDCETLNVSSNEGDETVVSETQRNSPESYVRNSEYSTYNNDITETLVSETAESPLISCNHKQFNFSPTNNTTSAKDEYSPRAIDNQILSTLCYSPINPDELEQLNYSPTQKGKNNAPQPSVTTTMPENQFSDQTELLEQETVTSETKYSPQNLTGEPNHITYTPCRPENFEDTRKPTNESSPIVSPYQNSIEMTPNETEMVCEDENQSDSDDSGESEKLSESKRKQRILSDDSVAGSANTSKETVELLLSFCLFCQTSYFILIIAKILVCI